MNKHIFLLEQTIQSKLSPSSPSSSPNGELSRLIAAAVVDRKFCKLLLENPAVALEANYGSESFHLTPQEKALVLSVQCPTSLADFAEQLTKNYLKATQKSEPSQD